ncbi:hypothetical protein E2C01_067476 [Portunus trituberculatus]|uniref:Uncharacterized protein n=1 Tax=Portunus trituberculatus TaxID=210409 RepID=A0A5B7HWT8_PORTR|nr:hypothetical protein [Portunus trituberculatus]
METRHGTEGFKVACVSVQFSSLPYALHALAPTPTRGSWAEAANPRVNGLLSFIFLMAVLGESGRCLAVVVPATPHDTRLNFPPKLYL